MSTRQHPRTDTRVRPLSAGSFEVRAESSDPHVDTFALALDTVKQVCAESADNFVVISMVCDYYDDGEETMPRDASPSKRVLHYVFGDVIWGCSITVYGDVGVAPPATLYDGAALGWV